ncbi:hypothetical protein TPL01_07190 [Sulfuriferula plumbiphila]|uniref:Lipoprotein n=1 Tax=Sulfuriferula plumbiphila TaxID=171865 RepID=A0A512L5Z1_9PROT|nr:hypothetical protein [Sulfuriferula plumbiphila]BBP05812.1 hypothetical protein SFPGR_32340 [Sulfuriferula plumbiphila]GEP29581.1 hypothetical protein TPL01_07190 [Sulfuriferula plumbiphila]
MKRFLLTAILAIVASPVLAADVGVSVSIGQPGFYGRIDIGNNYPQPLLIYPEPIVIQRLPVGVAPRPIYLHVPPGHAKHWRKHCHEYNACGRPVYFVQDDWYNEVYVPHYREDHGDRGGERDHENHGKRGYADEPGHGHGRDHGHGKGHQDD